jgi:hypothetical protein
MGLMWPLGLVLLAIESALFAWAASRFFIEARRAGELEVLLTTPLGAKEVVSTQWGVLKRLLRWPMLVMVAPAVVIGLAVWRTGKVAIGPPNSFRLPFAISSMINCVDIFLGVGALCWVGMWFGLKAGGQARAIVWTVGLVKAVPVLIGVLCSVMLHVLARGWGGWGAVTNWITLCLPQLVSLLFYAVLISLARQRLLGELAVGEPVRLGLYQAISSAAQDARVALRKARDWTPS